MADAPKETADLAPVDPEQFSICETTWLEGFRVKGKRVDKDTLVLMLDLPNGHRYCVPLGPVNRAAIAEFVKPPVPVFGPEHMPKNGQGSSLTSD